MSTDVQLGINQLRRWLKRHSQVEATIILKSDENNHLNVLRRYLLIPFCALIVNDKEFYDIGKKIVVVSQIRRTQTKPCVRSGRCGGRGDGRRQSAEQVVDLPRISPGRGGDLCGPHAPAAAAPLIIAARATHHVHPSDK